MLDFMFDASALSILWKSKLLLRRITSHVRNQNWFAVGIDFTIVVVGVFIGLQVANWNDQRILRIEEQALLQRLKVSFTAEEKVLIARLKRAEWIVASTTEIISLIRTGESDRDSLEMLQLLSGSRNYSVAVSPPTTFSEAVQAGRIASLRSDVLRNALNEYRLSKDWFKSVSGEPAPMVDPDSKWLNAVTISADLKSAMNVNFKIIDFDWDKLVTAEKEFGLIQRRQSFQAESYRLELDALRNVLAILEKKVASEDCASAT